MKRQPAPADRKQFFALAFLCLLVLAISAGALFTASPKAVSQDLPPGEVAVASEQTPEEDPAGEKTTSAAQQVAEAPKPADAEEVPENEDTMESPTPTVPEVRVEEPSQERVESEPAQEEERMDAPSEGETEAEPQIDRGPASEQRERLSTPAGEERPMEFHQPSEAGPVKLRFNFRYQPWADVIEWFAEQADLSLEMETAPPGTFNYIDRREYTPEQALDLLNSVLLTKGYTLLRREQMLFLINLEDGIPPNMIDTIAPEELEHRGDYELVQVLFTLSRVTPEEVHGEIEPMLGPQGAIIPLDQSQQLLVTETVNRLRAIQKILQRIDDPEGISTGSLHTITMENMAADEAIAIAQQLLDVDEENPEVRFAVDLSGTKIWLTGRFDMIERAKEIITNVDQSYHDASGGIEESLQLEVYPIDTADPESVLAVIQTLLVDEPDVRLSLDPKTNALVALGRPSNHQTIQATLTQMQSDAYQVEVIPLTTLDPLTAVSSIEKFFGDPTAEEGAEVNAPIVEADVLAGQLLVRGTKTQLAQIRILLEKMGETDFDESVAGSDATLRTIPLSSGAAALVLEQVREIWPELGDNEIRVVTPSAMIPSIRSSDLGSPPVPDGDRGEDSTSLDVDSRDPIPETTPPPRNEPAEEIEQLMDEMFGPQPDSPPAQKAEPLSKPVPIPGPETEVPPSDTLEPAPIPEGPPPTEPSPKTTRRSAPPSFPFQLLGGSSRAVPFRLVAQQTEIASSDETAEGEEAPSSVAGAPITISLGPEGIVIASEDTEALDRLEELIRMLADETLLESTRLTVYYLKHSTAEVVAGTLRTLLDGPASMSSGLEDDLMSSLMSLGASGSIESTGPVQITSEPRLNALLIQANPVDHRTIERLLPILDQLRSPEDILIKSKPHLIPLKNTRAEDLVDVVKEVFATYMEGGQPAQQAQRQGGGDRPSPMEMFMRMRGGRGREEDNERGRQTQNQQEVREVLDKMTVSVDPRSNSLIVSAPEAVFLEVEAFVKRLDEAALESDEVMEVYTLRNISPELLESALSSLGSDSVVFNRSGGGESSNRGSRSSSSRSSGSDRNMDAVRARIEAFRRMRESGGRRPSFRPPGGGR